MSFDNINSTERYEESINDISNRTKVKKHKTKKVTIDLNEMASFGRSRDLGASVESLDSLDTGQPKRTARDDVLESLGYKSNRIPKPNVAGQQIMTTKNLCHYCGRRVRAFNLFRNNYLIIITFTTIFLDVITSSSILDVFNVID